MGREDSKTCAGGLVLLRGSKCPERNRATTKLGEPALKLRLGSIVRQTRHVQDLAPLREERPDICPGVHGSGQNVGVIVRRLRFADQTTENSSQSNGFFHGTAGRGGSQSLEMERQIMFDRSARLHWLDLKSGADV